MISGMTLVGEVTVVVKEANREKEFLRNSRRKSGKNSAAEKIAALSRDREER